ncbi:MAG: lysylphosphatidylglycerol synthase domain-containing protein [Gemmatimonadaceae bacterium]
MPSSTVPPQRRQIVRAVFALLAGAAVWLAGRDIFAQWLQFRASGTGWHPVWSTIGVSCLVVFLAYAILIETWRRTVGAWGERIEWGQAARIWFISNLGRYLPGKIWQLGAMSAMAQARGVSPVAAAGSAIVVNLVNLLAGVGVVAVTGAEYLAAREAAVGLAVTLVAAIVATPWILPLIARLASVVLRRPIELPRLPHSALWTAAVGCIAAWVLYGIAFWLLVAGTLGRATGPLASYIAAFTGSYLVGYIAIFAPGGIGVREKSLVASLNHLGLPPGAPGIVALTSRLWLTVLEVVPGILLLALSAVRGERPLLRNNGSTDS